ncbi:hypothetical protein PGB90_004032 [Kerria lacca]
MIIRPAGFSSDEDSENGYESGYFEDPIPKKEPLELSFQKAIQNGSLLDIEDILTKVEDYKNFILHNGWTPLSFAAHLGNPEILRCILSYEHDNKIAEHKAFETPLVMACSSNSIDDDVDHFKCVELLLNAGFDPNVKNLYGVNALMMACKNGFVRIVELLLTQGVEVNDVDNDGWSALFYAVNRGDLNIIEILLKYNADTTKRDKKNRLPYDIAIDKDYSQIISVLKQEVISDSKTDNFQSKNELILQTANKNMIIFNKDDTHYYNEVSEMILATASDMKRYLDIFSSKYLNLRQLLLLKSKDELKKIGVIFSLHRKTILERIRLFHLGSWSTKSFGLTMKNDENQLHQLMTTFTFVSTLYRQLYILRSTIMYIRNDILTSNFVNEKTTIDSLKNIKTILILIKKRLFILNFYASLFNKNSHPFLFSREIKD